MPQRSCVLYVMKGINLQWRVMALCQWWKYGTICSGQKRPVIRKLFSWNVVFMKHLQAKKPLAYLDEVPEFRRYHDDVIKWKHFPGYWPFTRGIHRSPVKSLHKGQWRRALMFSLICAWINGWVNNSEAGDLRRHRAHYDVTLMIRLWSGSSLIRYCRLIGTRPLNKPMMTSQKGTIFNIKFIWRNCASSLFL